MNISTWWIINILSKTLDKTQIKGQCYYTCHISDGNLSIMNPLLKFDILLRTKSDEKFPLITSYTSCCSKPFAAIISSVHPQYILGPALSWFYCGQFGVSCVCLCVNHELPFRAIIHHQFKLGSQNLDQRCERPWHWPSRIWIKI